VGRRNSLSALGSRINMELNDKEFNHSMDNKDQMVLMMMNN